ncbi:fasciclin-1-like [Haliotis cracherodii]|uniref:fasciclin-1-like n=1 Tax=Haliotis cracherodii TaxID=6455 RepID=UPI0039EC2438
MANLLVPFVILIFICHGNTQDVDNTALNIFDALSSTLNCGQFKNLVIASGMQVQDFFKMSQSLTLFAPNDTAFEQMLPDKRQKLFSMTASEKADYVKSFTLTKVLQTSSMNENLIEKSQGALGNTNIFFYKRERRRDNIVSGLAGRTEYYANGALIYKPDVRTQNGIVHIIDRVLDPIVPYAVYGYIQRPDILQPALKMKFFTEVTEYVRGEYYAQAISPLTNSLRFTMFIPTDEAINKIPKEKLDELRSKQPELARVIKQHAIPNKAVYTSFVNHNEGFQCLDGRAVFKKNIQESVYVSAGGVNALISRGNLTLSNGVIHFVDSLLGFVYNTAREQIQLDSVLSQFRQVLDRSRKDLQDFLVVSSGVTLFVPMNDAFTKIQNLPGVDFFNNQTLINYVTELHMLEPGLEFAITNVNGDYQSRIETPSQYRGWNIKIYSQGNDTWAEGGYVKTRVIRPDVGVTNGFIHYVDGIFGVPYRDVPGIIYCEDWLIKASYILSITGLNDYLKDIRMSTMPACSYNTKRRDYNYADPNLFNNNQNVYGTNTNSNSQPSQSPPIERGGCGESNTLCQFTVFVPNGTTIDNFGNSYYGRQLFQDNNRLRYVLRRHIALNRKIYVDQLSLGTHVYTADSGDEVRFNKINDKNTEVYFQNTRARIIHSDLGATNGVIHIVDDFLFVNEDMTRDISGSPKMAATKTTTFISLMVLFYSLFSCAT